MSRGLTKKTSFTLIELLVVVAIIAVLAGLLLPVLQAARTRAKIIRARAEIQQLVTAWLAYYDEYRRFPSTSITMMGPDAVDILRGTTNRAAGLLDNPHRVAFHDFNTNTTYFCDPWGTSNTTDGVYRVALDTNLDNQITIGAGTNVMFLSVGIWSFGPDKRPFTADDVVSWRK